MKLTIGPVLERPPFQTDFGTLNKFVYTATLEDGTHIVAGQSTKGSNRPKEGEVIDFEFKKNSDGETQMFVDDELSAAAGKKVWVCAIKRLQPSQYRDGGQGQHRAAPAPAGYVSSAPAPALPPTTKGLSFEDLAALWGYATTLVERAAEGSDIESAARLEAIQKTFVTLFIGADKIDLPSAAKEAFDQPIQTLSNGAAQPPTDTVPEQPSNVPF